MSSPDPNIPDDEKLAANQAYFESGEYKYWSRYPPDAFAAGAGKVKHICHCAAHPGVDLEMDVGDDSVSDNPIPFPHYNVLGDNGEINVDQAVLNQQWLVNYLPDQAAENGGNRNLVEEGIDYGQQCTDFFKALVRRHFNKVAKITKGPGAEPNLQPPYPEIGGAGGSLSG